MPHPSNLSAMNLFLRRLCAHSLLNGEERAAILGLPTKPFEIGAHVDFVRLGETLQYACLVSEGLVGRFGQTEDGKRQFVSIHVPGEMVDLPSVVMPHSTSALNALTATSAFKIPHENLRELGFRYPAIAAAFWRDCVIDARIVAEWLVNIGRRDARSRIAHFLCELAVRYRMMDQSDGRTFRLPMTQEQLGDSLGLTPVHINRMLMSLRAEGVVAFDRGRVEILDWEALARTGEFDVTYINALIGQDLAA